MNIAATAILVSAITVVPQFNRPQIALPANPIDGLYVSAAGIEIQFTGAGLDTQPAKMNDFQIELRLKSGIPIRVRF